MPEVCLTEWFYGGIIHFFLVYLHPLIFSNSIMCPVSCLHVYLCTTYMLGAGGSQKGVSEPLELGLLTAVSCHVGAR